MRHLSLVLQEKILAAIEVAFSISAQPHKEDVVPSTSAQFGHYQSNCALRLSKELKEKPRSIAEKIVEAMDHSICSKVEIAGPGFINLTLSNDFLSQELQAQRNDPLLGAMPFAQKQRVIVEFSSPNVAKELHVGHIRSTILGDCLARTFEFLGQDVLRLNHLGDWGTQFGMLIAYMQEEAPEVLEGKKETSLEALMQWYRAAKKRFDIDEAFKKRAQLKVVDLQAEESVTLAAWQRICEISRIGFQEIYDLLDVSIEERGESFYNPYLKEVVQEFEEKGLVTLSDGAKCVFLEGFQNREGDPLPYMIQKSDGGYNYDTTDLAALKHRIFQEKADRIVVITDAGQSLHFQMLFAAAEKAGWLQERTVQLDHVAFGLVLGPDGKKFKTRSGETEKLIDFLLEAVKRSLALVEERLPEASEEEKKKLAYALGIGAIKYADLSSCRTKDYTFSYDRMLKFEGNTAVFLLYAYVRIQGILKKSTLPLTEVLNTTSILLEHPSEIRLGLHLRRFSEVLEEVVTDLYPHKLTEYLYHLAEEFNAFFRDCRVVGAPEEKQRLVLCFFTAQILKQGLSLLGLKTVDRM